jgi:NADPH-dependent 2,4-dienoyl-CoA reductase/sulfur reductase-like enzyme
MAKLLIIGGSDAGVSAALRAREIDHAMDIMVLLADRFPNYSICGLPFYLSGEVSDWHSLAHRTVDEIEKQGIRLLMEHRATGIDPEVKTVTTINRSGLTRMLKFDKLIIGTGAVPARPSLAGRDLPGVFTLRWMEDGFAIQEYMEEHRPKSVLILGAGYIGMEMADALTRKGLSITLLARSGRILKTVDPEMGEIIRKELSRHDVRIIDRIAVTAIEKQGAKLVIRNNDGIPVEGDMVLMAAGGLPETSVAKMAGISTGIHGAIRVGRAMETSAKDIYAAGDCVETWHRLLKKYTYLPLGTTAHKQGRVAGENAAGGKTEFAGSLGTQVVKIFDIVVARTGLRESEAREAGFDPLTTELEAWDHKVYYPGATPLRIRITGDRKTHRLLGAQMIGHYRTEVSKRIDIFATAIFNDMTVESLSQLNLSYTPPLGSPWDPLQMASQAWIKELGS